MLLYQMINKYSNDNIVTKYALNYTIWTEASA